MTVIWESLIALLMLLAMFGMATLYAAWFIKVFFHNLRVRITGEGFKEHYR